MIGNCRFVNYNRTKRYPGLSSIRNTSRGRRNHRPRRDSIGKRDVRDRSRGHRGTIRRDRHEAATGRKGIKIEITSRTQGGACNGWIASPTLSPFLASVSMRRVASHDLTQPKIIADDISPSATVE